jgi:hypothetical protein
LPLNAGILIIGSLLWDDERQAWRDAQLQIAPAETATAPIRYTMVFSRLCQAGQVKVVRCSHTVSSAENLIAEAGQLWKAEQLNTEAGRSGGLGMRGVAVQA